MSLNGRLKARAASFARTAYPPILGSLRRVLSERQLQRFILVCDRLKGWLLKEAVVVPSPSPMALPPWIVDEMKALARIEPALYPSAAKLRVFTSWKAPIDNGPAQLYRGCLADFIEYAPDMVFLVPHLQRGGADLGILHHVRLCAEMGVKVTVVVTRDVVSPGSTGFRRRFGWWSSDAWAICSAREDRRLVLLRLLLQCPARSIHIINSQLAWELLERHGKTLTFEGKRIYASVFCDDLDGNAVRCGYASEFLPRSWMHLAGLLSDNRTFLQQIHERDGIPPELMHGLYFPASDHAEAIPTAGSTILWASRISPQKGRTCSTRLPWRFPNTCSKSTARSILLAGEKPRGSCDACRMSGFMGVTTPSRPWLGRGDMRCCCIPLAMTACRTSCSKPLLQGCP